MEIYFRFWTTPPPSFCINSKTCTFGNEGLPSTVRSPFFTEYFACYHICVLFHHQVLSQFCLNHQCTAMHINADQGLWRPVSTMHCLDPECIVLLINTAAAAEARSRWSESQLKCTPALFQGFPSTALRWRCIQKTFDKKHNKHHHNQHTNKTPTPNTAITIIIMTFREHPQMAATLKVVVKLLTFLTNENLKTLQYNHSDLTIKKDTGQHSQFLQCFQHHLDWYFGIRLCLIMWYLSLCRSKWVMSYQWQNLMSEPVQSCHLCHPCCLCSCNTSFQQSSRWRWQERKRPRQGWWSRSWSPEFLPFPPALLWRSGLNTREHHRSPWCCPYRCSTTPFPFLS